MEHYLFNYYHGIKNSIILHEDTKIELIEYHQLPQYSPLPGSQYLNHYNANINYQTEKLFVLLECNEDCKLVQKLIIYNLHSFQIDHIYKINSLDNGYYIDQLIAHNNDM